MAEKINRNGPYPCRSGKKYKASGLSNKGGNNRRKPWDEQLSEAAKLSLEFDQKKVETSIAKLGELVAVPGLTDAQKVNGLMSYATALRHHGEHRLALEQLEKIKADWIADSNQDTRVTLDLWKASCLARLGREPEAFDFADSILKRLSLIPLALQPGFLLQLSEVFLICGRVDRAEKACKHAMQESSRKEADQDVFARAMANLATIKLHHQENEQARQEGVRLMERSMELKSMHGDLQGLANAYNSLAMYYAKIERYERAIAFYRKDLQLSRQIGDLTSLAQTYLHLADLYSHLLQPNAALKALKEATELIAQVDNKTLEGSAKFLKQAIQLRQANAVENGETLGPRANCRCRSGKVYSDCCGRADFEPVSLPWDLKSHSETIQIAHDELKALGLTPNRLDFFFRPSPEIIDRTAWYRLAPRDGWIEVLELPDVANLQLRCARLSVAAATLDPESIEHPLSAIILAVCATESFINQVVFFVAEVTKTDSLTVSGLPLGLLSDPIAFQRRTELTVKWDSLGKSLCGSRWPSEAKLFKDFQTLVRLRNEFVHFKITAYERIIPPPKDAPEIFSILPTEIVLRETSHSWPFRVLTASAAKWATDTAARLMSDFRETYIAERVSASVSARHAT